MSYRIRDNSVVEVNRILGALSQELADMRATLGGKLPTEPPRSPSVGQAWYDPEAGKIYIYHSNGIESWSKD